MMTVRNIRLLKDRLLNDDDSTYSLTNRQTTINVTNRQTTKCH